MLLILGAFTDAPNKDAPVINIPHAAPIIEKPKESTEKKASKAPKSDILKKVLITQYIWNPKTTKKYQNGLKYQCQPKN